MMADKKEHETGYQYQHSWDDNLLCRLDSPESQHAIAEKLNHCIKLFSLQKERNNPVMTWTFHFFFPCQNVLLWFRTGTSEQQRSNSLIFSSRKPTFAKSFSYCVCDPNRSTIKSFLEGGYKPTKRLQGMNHRHWVCYWFMHQGQ